MRGDELAVAEAARGGGRLVGTPFFMAPEVMARGAYTAAADVWSFAGVVLEMTTGRPPWKELGFTRPRDLFEHVTRSPLALPATPPAASRALLSLLRKCFVREPARRPSCERLLSRARWCAEAR